MEYMRINRVYIISVHLILRLDFIGFIFPFDWFFFYFLFLVSFFLHSRWLDLHARLERTTACPSVMRNCHQTSTNLFIYLIFFVFFHGARNYTCTSVRPRATSVAPDACACNYSCTIVCNGVQLLIWCVQLHVHWPRATAVGVHRMCATIFTFF